MSVHFPTTNWQKKSHFYWVSESVSNVVNSLMEPLIIQDDSVTKLDNCCPVIETVSSSGSALVLYVLRTVFLCESCVKRNETCAIGTSKHYKWMHLNLLSLAFAVLVTTWSFLSKLLTDKLQRALLHLQKGAVTRVPAALVNQELNTFVLPHFLGQFDP